MHNYRVKILVDNHVRIVQEDEKAEEIIQIMNNPTSIPSQLHRIIPITAILQPCSIISVLAIKDGPNGEREVPRSWIFAASLGDDGAVNVYCFVSYHWDEDFKITADDTFTNVPISVMSEILRAVEEQMRNS